MNILWPLCAKTHYLFMSRPCNKRDCQYGNVLTTPSQSLCWHSQKQDSSTCFKRNMGFQYSFFFKPSQTTDAPTTLRFGYYILEATKTRKCSESQQFVNHAMIFLFRQTNNLWTHLTIMNKSDFKPKTNGRTKERNTAENNNLRITLCISIRFKH